MWTIIILKRKGVNFMKTLLEELWFDYQIEKSAILSKKHQGMQSIIVSKFDMLLEMLNENQKLFFNEFTDSIYALQSELEKDAFIEGVSFGTKFITETLLKQCNIKFIPIG